jgi:p-aminobenzoyl-glutamate transporter AbgT
MTTSCWFVNLAGITYSASLLYQLIQLAYSTTLVETMHDTSPTGNNSRFLAWIERTGNRLPDPAILFVALLFIVWILSLLLSTFEFSAIDPRTGEPVVIVNQLSGPSLTSFMASMVKTFAHFHPIGVVLVAMLGIGVAEHTGFISASLRAVMEKTSRKLLTPMVILVGIMSHTAADAGYVLVIPLGGALFYAAGRHPLAGIAAAFAGVSGGFSANFVPSANTGSTDHPESTQQLFLHCLVVDSDNRPGLAGNRQAGGASTAGRLADRHRPR